MRVESFEMETERTCRKCFTIYDFRRDYCCVKSKDECFADMDLVKKGVKQDEDMAEKLFITKSLDYGRKLQTKKFFRGRFRNECTVHRYRPPGCRSHFCWRWDKYMAKKPRDFIYANLNVVPLRKLLDDLYREYEYGIRLAYPGGYIIYTYDENLKNVRKEIEDLLNGMKLKHFRTNVHLMDPEKNGKEGVEIITDDEAVIEKTRLFSTMLKNNMFMLYTMKMNMGSTGHKHSNILITNADFEKLAEETPSSLKTFHALKAYRV